MHKSRVYLEKMLALVLMTYAIALLNGEAIRDVHYAGIAPSSIDFHTNPGISKSSKWFSFSGLFLLLKRRICLDQSTLRLIIKSVLNIFSNIVNAKNVRSFVLNQGMTLDKHSSFCYNFIE